MGLEDENTQLMEACTDYVEQHKVFNMFEDLMQQLVINKPDDPVTFLIDKLKQPKGAPNQSCLQPLSTDSDAPLC